MSVYSIWSTCSKAQVIYDVQKRASPTAEMFLFITDIFVPVSQEITLLWMEMVLYYSVNSQLWMETQLLVNRFYRIEPTINAMTIGPSH